MLKDFLKKIKTKLKAFLEKIKTKSKAFLEKINKKVESKYSLFKTFKTFLILLLPFFMFGFDFFSKKVDFQYQLVYFAINCCLSLILCIHIFTQKSFAKRQKDLKGCFKYSDYVLKCENYQKYSDAFLHRTDKLKHKIAKILYSLIWLGFVIFTIWCILETDICKGVSGRYSIIIFVMAMALNWKSYYFCVAYVYFLSVISSNINTKGLNKYQYNKFLPSSTNGFQRLLSNVHTNATYFLLVSLLYTISFLLILLENKGFIRADSFSSLLLTFFDIFFGFGSCIFIYLTPTFLLKRILNKWTEKSNKEFEKKILSLKTGSSNLQVLLTCIKNLKNERALLNIGIIEIIISIMPVVVAISTLIISIPD